jgi:hypothetical protein
MYLLCTYDTHTYISFLLVIIYTNFVYYSSPCPAQGNLGIWEAANLIYVTRQV